MHRTKSKILRIGTLATLGTISIANAAPLAEGTAIGVDFGPTAATNFFNDTGGGVLEGIFAGDTVIDITGAIVDSVSIDWGFTVLPAPENRASNTNESADSTDLPGQPSIFNDSNLTDWIHENNLGNAIFVNFSGLDDSLTYELVIGSGFTGGGANTDTTWTADGQSATTDHASGPGAYVTLSGLSTDGSGNLNILGVAGPNANNGRDSTLSVLQLTAIPEPGSFVLLALGSLMMIVRHRNA